jgi:hypothetical protein
MPSFRAPAMYGRDCFTTRDRRHEFARRAAPLLSDLP